MNTSPFKRRFPGYNVLDKWNTPSWNEQTRRVIYKRLHEVPERRFFSLDQWQTLVAVCDRIIPQPDRPDNPVPIAPFIDDKMYNDHKDGFRFADMPPMQAAWTQGLKGIDDESHLRFDAPFRELAHNKQDEILAAIQKGEVESPIWQSLPPKRFFYNRLLTDIVSVYYSHPEAWNEIGFGGPASPRGYVRLGFNRLDPWEAVEDYSD